MNVCSSLLQSYHTVILHWKQIIARFLLVTFRTRCVESCGCVLCNAGRRVYPPWRWRLRETRLGQRRSQVALRINWIANFDVFRCIVKLCIYYETLHTECNYNNIGLCLNIKVTSIDFLRPVFAASRVQHVSDLHPKFALRPHHMADVQSATAEIRRGKKKEDRTNDRAKI